MQQGCVFKDPNSKYNGIFWFFEGTINDGKGKTAGKKLFAIYDDGKELKNINPSVIWDLEPVDEPKPIKKSFDKSGAQNFAINSIRSYLKDLKAERERQAQIKRKYGVKSLEFFIGNLDEDLEMYYIRQEMGENVDLAIRNKEDKKKNYEIALKKLEDDIIKEESLSMSMPKFLGAVLVEQDDETQIEDVFVTEEGEISAEMVGMNISMEYEQSEGRNPIDVSENNLGFDIKSKDNEGNIRYIEVKARSDEGLVKLTLNEWFKAKRFKKAFWLYVVVNIAR